jgi:hypothetical protein
LSGVLFPAPHRTRVRVRLVLARSPPPSPSPPRARTPRRLRPLLFKRCTPLASFPPRCSRRLAQNPSARAAFAARAPARRRAAVPLPPAVAQPPPEHRVVVRMLGRPSFPSSPLRPWTLGVHRSSPPPLAVGRHLRPPPLPLYPLDRFTASPSLSPTRSYPESSPEMQDRVSPASLRCSGRRRRLPSAASHPPLPWTVRSRSIGRVLI